MDWNEFPLDSHHVGVPSVASKMISKAIAHSVQIMNLSCIEINTISKETKMIFLLTYMIKAYPQVCPKRFQSLWYIRHKSCTYLTLRLVLSKQIETSFHFTNFTLKYHWVCLKRFPHTWYIRRPKQFLCPWYIHRKPCTYHVSRQTQSSNGSKRASISPTWSRSSIGCTQNDFCAHGTFGANPAPILHLD
jgi:hypothetical protein